MTEKKQTGSFYTCDTVADFLTAWAIQNKNDSLLEPSFGDGVFIDAAIKTFNNLANKTPTIFAVELQQTPFEKYMSRADVSINGFCEDFMQFNRDIKVNAVVGNPPYVRLKNLSAKHRLAAVNVVEKLKIKMLSSGSLWMPFIIQATQFLQLGGRIGFVLPFEITYVKYAYPLWDYLKKAFGHIKLYRVHEDIFPDVDVETVLFMAEDYGKTTDSVEYSLFVNKETLFQSQPTKTEQIPISDIVSGGKPFVWSLLNARQKELIRTYQSQNIITPISSKCKFKIGYVCADKAFFHPSLATIKEYELPKQHLHPCISNSKDINGGTGIGVEIENGQCSSNLYVPLNLTSGDKKYIAYGERQKVNERYKCKIRKPWYVTPGIERADLVLTVFGDMPKLLSNEGDYAVSNSLLSGVLVKGVTGKEIVCRWYNSLTLLSAELNVHSLGGGVLVFIPGETDKIEVLNSFPQEKIDSIIDKFNGCILTKGLTATYMLGDEIVLKQIMGFSEDEILTIRQALKELQFWRRPDDRRSKK